MAVSYSPADRGVCDLLADVVRTHRADLHDAGVSFAVGMAACDDAEDRPLKVKGVPCLATVRVVPHLYRAVAGVDDVLLLLDLREWAAMRDRHRAALLHHEVEHVELAEWGRDDQGIIRFDRDDGGRPKLKTRPADLNPPDAFLRVIAAHGDWSHEYAGIRAAHAAVVAAHTGEVAAADDDPPHTLFGDAE